MHLFAYCFILVWHGGGVCTSDRNMSVNRRVWKSKICFIDVHLLACYLGLEHINFQLAYSLTRIASCLDLEDCSFGHLGLEFETPGLNRYEFFRKQFFDEVFSVLMEINTFHCYYGYVCSLIFHARLCVKGATYLMTC